MRVPDNTWMASHGVSPEMLDTVVVLGTTPEEVNGNKPAGTASSAAAPVAYLYKHQAGEQAFPSFPRELVGQPSKKSMHKMCPNGATDVQPLQF